MPAQLKLAKYLANLGYGSRREVERMLREQRVTSRDGKYLKDGDPFRHVDVLVDGEPLDPPVGSLLMLHKPAGYETSTSGKNKLIYDLLPSRFLLRSPVMAPIGRLDLASSGLLLLTDDGKLNHRIASPRKHLPKTYEAHLAEDLKGNEAEVFASGTMLLESETTPLRPAKLEIIGPRHVRVTLTEGRYHQVRRMFAAFGNNVTKLHRIAIGELQLGDLPLALWRVLSPAELKQLLA